MGARDWVGTIRTAGGFGNPRYGRLGGLRYREPGSATTREGGPPVAQVAKPAVSPTAKSAERSIGARDWAGANSAGQRVWQPAIRQTRRSALRPGQTRRLRATAADPVAQVAKPAVSPTAKSAWGSMGARDWVGTIRTAGGFGNPRYGRLGGLRYREPGSAVCATAGLAGLLYGKGRGENLVIYRSIGATSPQGHPRGLCFFRVHQRGTLGRS